MSHELFNSYLNIESDSGIKLTIVGKDPYPSNPCYIPFCKASWSEQLSNKHCGIDILKSIGIDIDYASTQFNSPIDFFIHLRQQGVVFLNLSYQFIGEKITKRRNILNIIEAYEVNKNILNNSEIVILCGEANKLRWIEDLTCPPYHCAIHPDRRNRINLNRVDLWNMWWSKDSIAKMFKVNLNNIQNIY